MALTTREVATAFRLALDDQGMLSEDDKALVLRLMAASMAVANRFAPDAPARSAEEAIVRMAAYMFDAPESPAGDRYAAAFRNSGAMALLAPFKVRRAGAFSDEDLAPELAAKVQDDLVLRWCSTDDTTRTVWNSNA